jgi:HTH-type transcriptional repressor of NAD biosynthesis genes
MTVGHFSGKFLPFHTGHLLNAIAASQYVDKLYVVLTYNNKRDAEQCKIDNCKEMPGDVRLSWLGYCFKDYPNIEVLGVEDFDDEYDWFASVPWYRKNVGEHINYVFSSEPSYDNYFKKMYPEAEHICLDEGRQFVNISGTEIRKDIYKHWNFMPKIVRKHFVKKVLITGVESVGKSTMVHKLGTYFNTTGVQEVGRTYCENYKNCLTIEHFDNIAMEHWLAQDDACYNANEFMFVDSDAIVTKYYLDKYHHTKSSFLDAIISKQQYDYIFYLEPTVKWIADEFRFLEKSRDSDNKQLKEMYSNYNLQYISSDNYNQRFLDIISLLFSH